FRREDDPRLGDVIVPLTPSPLPRGERGGGEGRAVLVGFPQDEGVRRNGGRPGAAEAPGEVRRWLARLGVWDALADADLSQHPPLDAGNVRVAGSLEESQSALGEVVAALLRQ